jgi:hypothetical protein
MLVFRTLGKISRLFGGQIPHQAGGDTQSPAMPKAMHPPSHGLTTLSSLLAFHFAVPSGMIHQIKYAQLSDSGTGYSRPI